MPNNLSKAYFNEIYFDSSWDIDRVILLIYKQNIEDRQIRLEFLVYLKEDMFWSKGLT